MVIPAMCQAGLFFAELYLNNESEKIAVLENNELEANAIVLNIIAYADNGWSMIFDETIRGQAVSRTEFKINQRNLLGLVQQLKELPIQNDLTKEIYSYASIVVSVLEKAELENGETSSNGNGDQLNVFSRLAKVRKTAFSYINNFQHLLSGLNKQRTQLHELKLLRSGQHARLQHFLIISLIFDAAVVLILPIIFLRDITNRLKILLDNAKKLPTNQALAVEIGGRDEITFLNSALCEVAQRLREAEQSKQLLIDMLAHDIRSPLTSAELLLHDVSYEKTQFSVEGQRKFYRLELVFRQIKRLVEDLLSIERLEDGDFDLTLDFFDIIETVKMSIDTIEPQASSKSLTLELKTFEPKMEIVADRERLLQVMDNLLSNAVKHSPTGGIVRVTLTRGTGLLRVAIADEGQGVPPNLERLVFDRKFQTDAGRTRGGFGLGLTIAKQIVSKHGGSIKLENRRPHGCLVSFSLPIDSDTLAD